MSVRPIFEALEARAAARPDSAVLVGDRQTWRADTLLAAIDELATRLAPSRAIAVSTKGEWFARVSWRNVSSSGKCRTSSSSGTRGVVRFRSIGEGSF